MNVLKFCMFASLTNLLAGCGEGAAPVAPATVIAATSAPVSAVSSVAASVSSVADAGSKIEGMPGFTDACRSLPGAGAGRQMGGARQCLEVRMDSNSSASIKFHGVGQLENPVDVTTDGRNLYVIDAFNHSIYKVEIASGEVVRFAGTGKPGAADGVGDSASFNEPVGITTDGTHLYVADRGNNRIRKIQIASGKVTTLVGVEICGSVPPGYCFLGGITFDGHNLYAVNSWTIRKINPETGQVSTLEGTPAGSMTKNKDGSRTLRFDSPSGITTDGTNLFVIAYPGVGSHINHIIYKIDIASGVVIDFVDMQRSLGFFKPHLGITTDGAYLYVASSQSHEIFRIDLSTTQISLMAGSGESIKSADGMGREASFSSPLGLTSDGRNLYVADSYNRKIRQIALSNNAVSTLAGSGFKGFDLPVAGLASDGKTLFVVDASNSTVRRIEIEGGLIRSFAGAGKMGLEDGAGAEAKFNQPKGVFMAGESLFIADYANHAVRKIDLASGEVSTLAGAGEKGLSDGRGKAVMFNYPYDIAGDEVNLYVTDYDNHAIRVIEIASGDVRTLAGSGVEGAKDGTGKAASFNHPRSVVVVGRDLFVTDTVNHKIRRVEIDTGKVTTLAGGGEPGFADGKDGKALFNMPSGMVSDGSYLYLADYGNHAIRKIEIASGSVSTLAGSGREGLADGIGTAASFNQPLDLALVNGVLYVADSGNHLVRQIAVSTGAVSTLALSGGMPVQ